MIERIQNGFVPTEDDCSSICSDQSSLSERSGSVIFPSSHPCIESRVFGTDNGALVLVPILGMSYVDTVCGLSVSLWSPGSSVS